MARSRFVGLLVAGTVVAAFGALAAAVESGYRDADLGPSTPESTRTPVESNPSGGGNLLFGDLFGGVLPGLPDLGVPAFDGLGFLVLLGGAVLVLGGLATLIANRPGGSIEPVERGTDEGDDAVDLEAVGRAAGDAADRIESGSAEASTNEVYRAWDEMTGLLQVPDPDVLAPDEFEQRAVDAGMAPEDVRELTRLFEEVRYGDRDPAAREDRAVAALRRIEAAYAAEGADR